ncbi:MAG: MFS transporter [bacterium]|nr:MFS transporter [bacterium]
MPHLTCTEACSPDELQRLLRPRSDVVVEEPDPPVAGDAPAPETPAPEAAFRAVGGPFTHYRRTVHVLERGDAGCLVRQHISYRLSVPVWGWFLTPLANRQLRRPRSDGTQPFWAPAERLDPRSGQVLGVLCLLAVVAGYLGTLLSQTITFAFDEFDAGLATQGNTLTAVRVGVLLALALVALADRRGRRPMLLFAAVAGCLVATATAASTGVWTYGASQAVSRSLATAMLVLLVVIAAEEVPAGARAYAVSVLTLSAGLGSGMVVWLLPLADLGLRAWRILFLAPLLALPLVLFCARRLPESRRFAPQPAEAPPSGHPGDAERRRRRAKRMFLLGCGALGVSLFAAPASQFLNEFLRSQRSFSAGNISVFQLSINTPAAIGVLIGGRFSDVRGRRRIGALGLAAGAAFTVFRYVADGWPMWMWGVLAGIFGAASVPIMGAFGGELFGTSNRAGSNGLITTMGVIGSVIGLQIVGRFTDAGGEFGHVFAMIAGAPLVVALLILFAFPETAWRELEDLNPEDRAARPPPPG